MVRKSSAHLVLDRQLNCIPGMGARFASMPEYYNRVQAHGILAAIVFLFLIPFSILCKRFYGRDPWLALRIHIWCHVLAIFLATALFILGFMAVGTQRSLTNPHHGIGVALYVMLMVQFVGGSWMRRRERKRRFPFPSLKATVSTCP